MLKCTQNNTWFYKTVYHLRLFTPTFQFFHTDISAISVTFLNSGDDPKNLFSNIYFVQQNLWKTNLFANNPILISDSNAQLGALESDIPILCLSAIHWDRWAGFHFDQICLTLSHYSYIVASSLYIAMIDCSILITTRLSLYWRRGK